MAPFNNVKARQAVNWAVDRNAAVRLYGGPNLAQPACTILPPTFPGHVDSCAYTKGGGTTWTAPDIDKAKQLVQQSGTAGQKVDDHRRRTTRSTRRSVSTCRACSTRSATRPSVKPLSANIQFTYIQNTKNKVQIAFTHWYQDYPAASDFLNVLLSLRVVPPRLATPASTSPDSATRTIEPQMKDGAERRPDRPEARRHKWGQIDQAIMQKAPLAPLFNPKLVDFVSKRVGNYGFSKQFYMAGRPGLGEVDRRRRLADAAGARGPGAGRRGAGAPGGTACAELARDRAATAAAAVVPDHRDRLPGGAAVRRRASRTPTRSAPTSPAPPSSAARPCRCCSPAPTGLGLGVTPIGPTWDPAHYFLGADNQGRDVMARLLYGGRNSLLIGLSSRAALLRASRPLVGVTAGYVGGVVDAVLIRLLDVVWAFPVYLLAICLSVVLVTNGLHLGPVDIEAGSLWLPIVIIAIDLRALRRPAAARAGDRAAATRSSSWRPSASAARTCASLRREILPNVLPTRDRVPAADDRAEHAHRVGPVIPVRRRAAARRELGHDHQRRPRPALHPARRSPLAPGLLIAVTALRAERLRRRRARRASTRTRGCAASDRGPSCSPSPYAAWPPPSWCCSPSACSSS